MARFVFRLRRVLEYRRMVEEWAERDFRDAQRQTREAEAECARISGRRRAATQAHPATLDERITLERYVERLGDELRAAEAGLAVLTEEEGRKRDVWIDRRRDAEALQKLHDKSLADWQVEQTRREQSEMDDWAVMRRAA